MWDPSFHSGRQNIMNLNELTIRQAREGLSEKKFTSVELTKACLDQIKKTDKDLNAFITITDDLALTKAKEIDKAGKFKGLAGVPVAIKDMFCTAGVKTTAASQILADYVPPYTATSAVKLDEAGTIMLGKVNCDEFAMGTSGENSSFGPAKNPVDHDYVPGGSSSGPAAAVAADQCLFSIGTDTGGSIRQPASFCGCVGLKPTYGRVSRYGVVAFASSLDTIGPLTKTVADAAEVLNVIAIAIS